MSELDGTDRQLLQQYLADKTPSASTKARAWEALEARLALAPTAAPPEPAAPAGLRLLTGLGLATQVAPQVSIRARRYGFWSYDARTM